MISSEFLSLYVRVNERVTIDEEVFTEIENNIFVTKDDTMRPATIDALQRLFCKFGEDMKYHVRRSSAGSIIYWELLNHIWGNAAVRNWKYKIRSDYYSFDTTRALVYTEGRSTYLAIWDDSDFYCSYSEGVYKFFEQLCGRWVKDLGKPLYVADDCAKVVQYISSLGYVGLRLRLLTTDNIITCVWCEKNRRLVIEHDGSTEYVERISKSSYEMLMYYIYVLYYIKYCVLIVND